MEQGANIGVIIAIAAFGVMVLIAVIAAVVAAAAVSSAASSDTVLKGDDEG
ncbi:MAG: hypothetical protein J5969_00875 [Lachnospiraceae bacterium]|nr:hypothetical protein [Lachnospiraceae bacterium]